jgi:predicted flap endonuclease-1-like 5' DNA nuclease
MSLILLDAFSNITEGPGPESTSTYTAEILIMLLVAFILGYLLRYFIGGKSAGDDSEYKLKLDKANQEIASLKTKSGNGDDLNMKIAQINALKTEITHLKGELSDCISSKGASTAQGIVAATPVSSSKKDDLKKVEGIGPKIESLLNAADIITFAALSTTTPERIREILLAAGERYRIHDPSTWPQQAAIAAKGAWAELKAYQESLNGGKE